MPKALGKIWDWLDWVVNWVSNLVEWPFNIVEWTKNWNSSKKSIRPKRSSNKCSIDSILQYFIPYFFWSYVLLEGKSIDKLVFPATINIAKNIIWHGSGLVSAACSLNGRKQRKLLHDYGIVQYEALVLDLNEYDVF